MTNESLIKGKISPPSRGMMFPSLEKAYEFYLEYAFKMGFAITKRTSHKVNGHQYSATYICTRGRKPRAPKLSIGASSDTSQHKDGFAQRRTGSHFTNCQASLTVKTRVDEEAWRVFYLKLEHNHSLDPELARYHQCHRRLTENVRQQLDINNAAGVPTRHSINAILTQSGGYDNTTWIAKDLLNHVQAQRTLKLKDGDANNLMRYFRRRQRACPNFYYLCDYDDEGRLSTIFWADGRSRAAYRYFGDVVTFDTTYLTNTLFLTFSTDGFTSPLSRMTDFTSTPKFDKTPIFDRHLSSGSCNPPSTFTKPFANRFHGAIQFLAPEDENALDPIELTQPIRTVRSRQYVTSPFAQDELLIKDIDYNWRDTNSYNDRINDPSIPRNLLIPEYMQRVIYAWYIHQIQRTDTWAFNQGGYKVGRSDIIQLLHGEPATGDVIDSMLYIIHSFIQLEYAKWSFVNTHSTYCVTGLTSDELDCEEMKYFSRSNLGKVKWLFIPIEMGGQWFLVVFDFSAESTNIQAYIPNANIQPFRARVDTITYDWKIFLSVRLRKQSITKWEVNYPDCPRLSNPSDSGLYVAKYVDCIVNRRPVQFTLNDVLADRGRICYNLICASFFRSSFSIT